MAGHQGTGLSPERHNVQRFKISVQLAQFGCVFGRHGIVMTAGCDLGIHTSVPPGLGVGKPKRFYPRPCRHHDLISK